VRHVPDAEICVIINDDVEVVADWLDVLVFSLERNPSLGMLSLRSETGVIKRDQPPRPRLDYNEARIMTGGGSLTSSGGACFAFRRADWESVGWFDERYFLFYEEVDFGVSLATLLGKISAFASYPVVYHMGGATTTLLNPSQHLEESRAKFWEKWGKTMDQLRAEAIARPQPPMIEWNTSWKVSRLP
jgi:GT2 family glycosyltransferase